MIHDFNKRKDGKNYEKNMEKGNGYGADGRNALYMRRMWKQ